MTALARSIERGPESDNSHIRARTVVKAGAFAAILRPIGIAVALVVLGVPCIFAWNIYTASEARRILHESSTPDGKTTVETNVRRKVQDGEVELYFRRVGGKVVRVIAGQDAATDLANRILIELDEARREAKNKARATLDSVFAKAFATSTDDLDRYADWYFAWGRSWRFLYEAVTGAAQEALRLGFSRTQVTDAARHAVEDYLLRHYQEYVLKPGVRDPMIVAGVVSTFRGANATYLGAMASLDSEIQKFVAEGALHTETIDDKSIQVALAWDTEKWRSPRQYADDRFLEPARTISLVAGGAFLLGPMVDRVAAPFLARSVAQSLSSTRMAVAGASLGSIQPGLGTAIGAVGGLALDWGVSTFHEWMSREEFIADNSAALHATVAAWKSDIIPEIDRSIDVWFDDARAASIRISQAESHLMDTPTIAGHD